MTGAAGRFGAWLRLHADRVAEVRRSLATFMYRWHRLRLDFADSVDRGTRDRTQKIMDEMAEIRRDVWAMVEMSPDDLYRPEPSRSRPAIEREMRQIQAKMDKIHARSTGPRGEYIHQTRARATTANAQLGRYAERMDALRRELRYLDQAEQRR